MDHCVSRPAPQAQAAPAAVFVHITNSQFRADLVVPCQLGTAVSGPHSPQYRHFLTPQQVGAGFGATPTRARRQRRRRQRRGLSSGRSCRDLPRWGDVSTFSPTYRHSFVALSKSPESVVTQRNEKGREKGHVHFGNDADTTRVERFPRSDRGYRRVISLFTRTAEMISTICHSSVQRPLMLPSPNTTKCSNAGR
jgi:hypothetical protein